MERQPIDWTLPLFWAIIIIAAVVVSAWFNGGF